MTKTFLKRLLIYFIILVVGEAMIYYTSSLWIKPLAKMIGMVPQGAGDWGYGFGLVLGLLLFGISALFFFAMLFIFLYETFFKLKREYDSAALQPSEVKTVWPIEFLY